MKTTKIIITVLAVLLGLAIFKGCQYKKDRDRTANNLKIALNDGLSQYTRQQVRINGLEQSLWTQEQKLYEEKEARKLAEIEKDRYKNLHFRSVQNVTKLRGQIQILSDSLDQKEPVKHVEPGNRYIDPGTYLPLPWTFDKSNQWYNYTGGIRTDGLFYWDWEIPELKLDLTFGYTKRGKKPVVAVNSDFPYLNSIKVNSITVTGLNHRKLFLKGGIGKGGDNALYSLGLLLETKKEKLIGIEAGHFIENYIKADFGFNLW